MSRHRCSSSVTGAFRTASCAVDVLSLVVGSFCSALQFFVYLPVRYSRFWFCLLYAFISAYARGNVKLWRCIHILVECVHNVPTYDAVTQWLELRLVAQEVKVWCSEPLHFSCPVRRDIVSWADWWCLGQLSLPSLRGQWLRKAKAGTVRSICG